MVRRLFLAMGYKGVKRRLDKESPWDERRSTSLSRW
jgi:hypothetical protein